MSDLGKGSKIKDRYEILEERGKGALGTSIFLARDIESGDEVIVRVLPAGASNDPEAVARFMQSAELAKKLKHSNILPLLDAGEDAGTRFLVFRHEKGYFLNDYLEHRGRLDEKESARLVQSLCSALEYAWKELKIIHRNICPDTIFVAKGNIPKLTDFDLAKSLTSDSKLTVDGFTVGDPLYMSPEQARGESIDYHSDMYCVGLVFYQLLAGTPLFQGRAKMEILRAQVAEAHPPVKSVNPDVTDVCSGVLDKLLSKRPEDRYQSWGEAIAALDSIIHPNNAGGSGTNEDLSTSRYKMQAISMPDATTSKQTESAQTTSDSKSKIPVAAVIAVLLAVLVGVGVFAHFRRATDHSGSTATATPALLESEASGGSVADDKIAKPLKSEIGTTGDAAASKSIDTSGKASAAAVEGVDEAKTAKPVEKVVDSVKTAAAKEKSSALNEAKEKRNREACMNNLKQIGEALLMYANVFKTKFPEKNGAAGLDELRKNGFLEIPQVFICPSSGLVAAAPKTPITEETCDYVYVGGLSSEYSDPNTPLAWSKPGNHKDFGCVLYVSGEVKSFTGSNWLIHTKPPKK
jgi:serine/threonine protein kinase